MIDFERIGKAWEEAGMPAGGGADHKLYPIYPIKDNTPTAYKELVGVTYFGRHLENWSDLIIHLMSLPPTPGLSILVTAMSAGPDLWDGVLMADKLGLFEVHPNALFYGHDYSQKFTSLAQEAIYPRNWTLTNASDWNDMFDETTHDDFVTIKPHLRAHARFLPAGDVLALTQKFDAAVSHMMNPEPDGLEDKMCALASRVVACTSFLDTLKRPGWDNDMLMLERG